MVDFLDDNLLYLQREEKVCYLFGPDKGSKNGHWSEVRLKEVYTGQ